MWEDYDQERSQRNSNVLPKYEENKNIRAYTLCEVKCLCPSVDGLDWKYAGLHTHNEIQH